MDSISDTVAGSRMKHTKSVGNFSAEEDYMLSSSNTPIVIQNQKDTKHGRAQRKGQSRQFNPQKPRSILDELSLHRGASTAVKNGKIEMDGNTNRKADEIIMSNKLIMSKELERLHKLKEEVMRVNDERRKSYAGFGIHERRHRKSSVLGGRTGDINKDVVHLASETKSPRQSIPKRRITLSLPIERVKFQLPQIQQLDCFTAEQKQEANRNHRGEGVEKMQICVDESKGSDETIAATKSKSKQDEPGRIDAEQSRKPLSRRYGSPLPQVNRPPLEAGGYHDEAYAQGPQITVSNYVDLNLRVEAFVKKSQPSPSEKSLQVVRRRPPAKLPSLVNTMITKRNKTIQEELTKPSTVINTETCPPISFYEDRSWYYQEKRRKCRYLRVPDSPIPAIHTVFDKD